MTQQYKSKWLNKNLSRFSQTHPKSGVVTIDYPSLVNALDQALFSEEQYAQAVLEAVRKLRDRYMKVVDPGETSP